MNATTNFGRRSVQTETANTGARLPRHILRVGIAVGAVVGTLGLAVFGLSILEEEREASVLDHIRQVVAHHPEARLVGSIEAPFWSRWHSPATRLVIAMPMAHPLGNNNWFWVSVSEYGDDSSKAHVMFEPNVLVVADCVARTQSETVDHKHLVFHEPSSPALTRVPGWIPALCDSDWSAEMAAARLKHLARAHISL